MATLVLKKSTGVAVALALLAYASVVLVSVSNSGHPDAPSTRGTLVFSDDFERASVGESYFEGKPDPGYKSAGWRIVNGRLSAQKNSQCAPVAETSLT